MKQLSFLPNQHLSCGGSLNNTRQQCRTLSSKRPIHLVLKSKASVNLFKNRLLIKHLISKHAGRFGVKIYASSVQRDHVHLAAKIPCRSAYLKFIRTITGILARKMGAGLWKYRPFTHIATWGREFRNLLDYLFRNDMEVFKVWRFQRSRAGPT